VKVLFALSGNQCAHPDCTNTVIEPATEDSDAYVPAHICHIYAISENGPRGNPAGLTQQKLNSAENLILLCRHHHGIVDGQPETYPATLLKEWKREHEAKMQQQLSKNLTAVQADVFSHPYFPIALVDQKIVEEIENLRKSRFFVEIDHVVRSSLALGRCLSERELSGGSDEKRRQGLAWCARLLSRSDALNKAKEFLELAKTPGDSPEIRIAEAFILSQKGDKAAALQALAAIDSNASRSAGLSIVAHHDDTKGAVQWMNDTRYTADDLDADGKSLLLRYQLELGHWDDAAKIVNSLSESDFEKNPILHRLTALTKLIIAVPSDFRSVVLTGVPFDVVGFRLASDAVAMDARRASRKHFLEGVEAAKQLGYPYAERKDDEYALWLELRDPELSAHGKSRLETRLRDPSTSLGFVHYALRFGIKLDLDAVERDIERSIAINGGITIDAAIARFALASTKKTYEEMATYIDLHHDQLAAHIDPNLMRFRQIEMLLYAGSIDQANSVFNQLLEKGIPAEQENSLRRLISDAQGSSDPVKSYKEQYMPTGDLAALIGLVTMLEKHQRWNELCEFGRQLFEKTRDLSDAERLVNAFNRTHSSEALVDFLNENPDLLAQSEQLKMSYAWGLYNEGALLESRAELEKLSDDAASRSYRALQVNLGITMGDWASLSAYIASEYQNRQDRNARELMDAAQLALHIGSSSHAKSLVFEAAEKANDDADILTRSYLVATSAGWEDDYCVFQWLERAAELSDNTGPVQRASLKDILDLQPEWDRRESDTSRQLAQGQIPIFIAAELLNQTLISLTTFRALANLSETDPRRRNAIPAYSGERVSQQFDLRGKKVALDATALLTLSFLKILDVVLDAFETVYIPHSTLGWLFEEWQRATFHQPSRMQDARRVRDLLATDMLEKFSPSTVASNDIALQVGDELAALIAEAERVREGDDIQHIVVCSSPVYRLSSLMEEEADLTAHVTVLSSCLAVVTKLKQKGQISSDEEKRARAYLQLHEKPWPNQPKIADGATLYLDDLAITYLSHLGLLGKLKGAGLKAVASPGEVSEVDGLIAYERISEEAKNIIEDIRASLNLRIESGKVRVSGRRKNEEDEEKSIPVHPTADIIALSPHCDAAIVDDRFINQRASIGSGGTQVPVLSTLDLLDALVSGAVISDDDWLEYRTRLRRAGYFFVPVNEKELEQCLMASDVVDGNVLETAELKAIRENMLRVRMSDWLQLPKEAPWLDSTLKVFIRVLKGLWVEGEDLSVIKVRSDWILTQVEVRGWAHSFEPGNGDNFVRLGRGAYILLFTLLTDASQEMKAAYANWVEDRILSPIKEQFPDLYSWIVEQHRKQVAKVVETELTEGVPDMSNTPYVRSAIAQAVLELIPPIIGNTLLEDREFREDYGIKLGVAISSGDSSLEIQCSTLFNAIREILSGATEQRVRDTDDREWIIKNEAENGDLPKLVISADEQRLPLSNFVVLSPDSAIRLRSLDVVASDVNLPASAQAIWRNALSERALENEEIDQFHSEFRDTPVHMARSIPGKIESGRISIMSLVPTSRRYYERLVGVYDGSKSIKDYARGVSRQFIEQLLKWSPYDGFLHSLYLSSHSSITDEITTNRLSSKDIVCAFDFLEKQGDSLSQLGAIEIGLRILPEIPEIEPSVTRLVEKVRDDNVEGSSKGLKLLSALFTLVDGELSRIRLMSTEPPFYRRLASLSQAALIHRQLVTSSVDDTKFCEWAYSNQGEQYYMQTLADMRLEPRWNPELAVASQIKADFFGRIMIAAKKYEKNIKNSVLHGLILGAGSDSLWSLSKLPYPYYYLSGPLEGAEDYPDTLPTDLSETIATQINTEEIGPSSFIALINSAMTFRVDTEQVELAAKALKLANYRLANLEDKSQLLVILDGLATVAAASRSLALADELRILVRRYRRDAQYGFPLENEMRICLVASASRENFMNWREFVGDWLTELAFREFEPDEANVLHSHLRCLCHAVPDLWVSCARADAALMALNGRK